VPLLRIAPILVAAAAGILAASSGTASTWHVPSDAPTIQAGIDSAVVGDTVLVAPGTYTGSGNRDISFLGKNIVVLSEAGAASTTIDAQSGAGNPHRGFFIASGEGLGAVLDGFTIVRGYMGTRPGAIAAPGLPRTEHDLSGGGIKCQDASPTLRNLVLRDCGSEYTGGGLDFELFAQPVVFNCVIEGCFAGFQGGGITIETASNPTIRDCTVTGCTALFGGGIGCSAEATIINCIVAGNASASTPRWPGVPYGAAVAVIYPGRPLFQRVIVGNNCAPDGAGEIFIDDGGILAFGCSVFDPATIVTNGSGAWSAASLNVAGRPAFCFPLDCGRAPTVGGDYHLQVGSPGLAATSPCGQDIGPLGQGCVAQTRVEGVSWGRVKGLYR